MTRTRKTLLAAIAAILAASFAAADDYADARAELINTYQAKDYAAMRAAAGRAMAARPGYPGARFNLALAQSLDGDAAGSLETLRDLLRQQIDFGAADMAEFSALHGLPGWPDYLARIEALREPVGDAEVAWTHSAGDFIPEGIAVDPEGHGAWLGSIRNGTVRRLGNGAGLTAVPGPQWSVYGMRFRDDRLWFVSAAVGQFVALDPADAGQTGLFSVAAEGGQVNTEIILPPSDTQKVLGDLEFGRDDIVYLADQVGGLVYRYDLDARELSTLTKPGDLGSPQGMALAADGRHLYVADYIGGLARLDGESGAAERMAADPATNLFGIDGMYRYGNSLIAIQNGIRPNRVVQLFLSDDGTAIKSSRILAMNLPEFDEPNLGQVVGDDFYFVANSHWNRFDADGNLPPDLDGPVVLRIELGTLP